ncbi:hypothetical protein ACSMXM_05020 [Pacificimonas sp. ICDLI1SI03]
MDMTEAEVDRLLSDIWPEGMPERERVIFEGLLPAQRSEAIARLNAVWRAENGHPLKPLADEIGLGRAAFYNLRGAWKERSLEGIIANSGRRPRRIKTSTDSPIRSLARSILVKDEMTSRNIDIARRVLEQAKNDGEIVGKTEQIRLQWAERLVRHERRALSRDCTYLRNNFGMRLVLDLTAVSILLKGDSELAVVAVMLDAGSGLVLGSTLHRLQSAAELERHAVEEARRFVRRHGADRPVQSSRPCDLDLMLPPGVSDVEDGELREATRNLDIRLPGTYAFGQELVQLIGPKMGRIPFAPRKTLSIGADRPTSRRKVIELQASHANAFWSREVLRHNEPILAALDEANVFDTKEKEGRMAALFYAIDGLLLKL